MKIKYLALLLLLKCSLGLPLEGLYVGGQLGHVALTGGIGKAGSVFNNTIGFGIDLGFRTNPLLDVLFSSQYSSHSGGVNGLSLYSETLAANFHFLEANDFDVSAGAGPGFYFFKNGSVTESLFGIHLTSSCDVMASENLRIGLGLRFHKVFSKSSDVGDNFWTIMMRVGYLFGSGA